MLSNLKKIKGNITDYTKFHIICANITIMSKKLYL